MNDVNSATAEEMEIATDLSVEAFAEAPNEIEETGEAIAPPVEEEVVADPYAGPPEFWSAERKALWERIVDPEARQALHEMEKERARATSRKLEEAANERKQANERLQQYERERDQLAAWWSETGPQLAQAFRSKWETVDWNELAANNPSEYVRLSHERDRDVALMRQTAERHQSELLAAGQRAMMAEKADRAAQHVRLVEMYPEHFAGEKAQQTYDDLRDYLLRQDVPPERIPHIYESFVVGVALKAMLYDRAQEAAARAKAMAPRPATATQTPRRIAPGASPRGGQPGQSDAYRQARERLNNGDRLTEQEARLLFA